jgi:hypothetical protein
MNQFIDLFFLLCAGYTSISLLRAYQRVKERRIRFEEMQKKMNPERSLFKKVE